MKLHSKLRQRYALLFIVSIVVLSGCVVDEDPTGMQKEITVDGGSISIIDEHNNTIEVIFPKDALDKTTQIYVGVLSEQPELPIETQHVSAFEIKPYNTELYNPITVRVTYNNVIQDINRTALFRKKTDILVPLADRNFGIDSKSIEAETFSLGVFAEGKMSLEQINTQIGLIFASYGINWDQKNATMFDSFLSDDILSLWADVREDAKGELEYMTILQYLNIDTSDHMYVICSDIVEPAIDKLLLEDKPANPCDRTYSYTILDALDLLQKLGCNWQNRPIFDRFEEIMNDCGCFTFGSPDKVNLVSINAEGDGVSLTLYGNGTFSASSNLGSTSGSWVYDDAIIFHPVQDEGELDQARIGLTSNTVCETDTMILITPAWFDEEDEYHPPQLYELTVVNVILTH